jgi:hypothetical protein
LPENPDTTLWQNNRAVKRTVVEVIISTAKARSAAALVVENASAEEGAGAAEGATAGVGAPCAEDFRPPPFPAQTPPIINT